MAQLGPSVICPDLSAMTLSSAVGRREATVREGFETGAGSGTASGGIYLGSLRTDEPIMGAKLLACVPPPHRLERRLSQVAGPRVMLPAGCEKEAGLIARAGCRRRMMGA